VVFNKYSNGICRIGDM